MRILRWRPLPCLLTVLHQLLSRAFCHRPVSASPSVLLGSWPTWGLHIGVRLKVDSSALTGVLRGICVRQAALVGLSPGSVCRALGVSPAEEWDILWPGPSTAPCTGI